MKDRPILMSAPMVRAILAGTKTQTRRSVKPQPKILVGELLCWKDDALTDDQMAVRCPYGQPGDQLWVRETHAPQPDCSLAWERWMNGHGGEKPIIHYAADASERAWVEKWRPSIHMPRWASRITLEVTGVRVERLQDISGADALAEGIERPQTPIAESSNELAIWRYKNLWEEINDPGSWDANPWVWCVEFKRLEQSK